MADDLDERLSRLLPGGKGLWIPMDHGISGYPEKGLENMDVLVESCISAGADAIVLQKGVLTHQVQRTQWKNFVMHTSVSTVHGGERSGTKVLVGNAREALKRGANALSCQINLGDDMEYKMIESAGSLTSSAFEHNIPVLGMVYPRGPNMSPSEDDPTNGIAHAARVAWELGCHVAKVPWTGSAETFSEVCSGVPIPVLIAGGPQGMPFYQTLEMVEEALSAGGAGVCMGRQIFSANDSVARINALRAVIHEGVSADEAASYLR